MTALFAFGIPAVVGLIVALFVLYRMWWKKRLLLKEEINGTKLLIINRDLGTVRLLAIVEALFVLAFITRILRPVLPAIFATAILWYIVVGSLFVALAIIHISRAQYNLEKAVEQEIAKGHAIGDVVTIEVSGKVLSASPNKEGGEDIGVEISEVVDGSEGTDQQGMA